MRSPSLSSRLAARSPSPRRSRIAAARRRAGPEDRRGRRRHVDRPALLQPLPQQQHRRAHLRQARADGPRLEDDPGPRDVVEGDRRHDLGVQAAQGREVPRRHASSPPRTSCSRSTACRTCRTAPGSFTRVHEGDHREGDRRPVHDPLQVRGAVSAVAERPVDDLHRVEEGRRPAPRPRTSTPARRRSAAAATSSSSTCPATASSSCATTATGATKPPWDKVTFKIIKNEPARVAALLSGDVDAIEQPPTADLARIKGDPKFTVVVEDLAPRHLLQLRPPRPRRARSSPTRTASRSTRIRCSTCACAARSPRRSTAPAIAERVMEGQAIPSGQLVSDKLFGHVPDAQGRRVRSRGREEAARRGRLSRRLQPHDPRPDRPLRQRREDRAGGGADADARRHRLQGRDGADGRRTSARASKQEFSFHMVGWGASTGEASLAAALAARDVQPRQGHGRRQLGPLQQPKVDYLIEQALQQVDDENRARDAAAGDQARDGGPRPHADPLPVHDLGDEEERRRTRRAPTSTRSRSSSSPVERHDRSTRRRRLAGAIRHAMLVFIIRRSLQSVVVLLVMSLLVFVGVYAIGNPIDILINPQADQAERERAIAALGLDKPLCEQYLTLPRGALHGDLGRSFVHSTSGARADPRAHAGDAGARARRDADRDRARHSARPVGRAEAQRRRRPHDHGRLDPRLLAADVLGRPDADHGVLGAARLAAVERPRRDGDAVRRAGGRSSRCDGLRAPRACRRSTSRCSSSRC